MNRRERESGIELSGNYRLDDCAMIERFSTAPMVLVPLVKCARKVAARSSRWPCHSAGGHWEINIPGISRLRCDLHGARYRRYWTLRRDLESQDKMTCRLCVVILNQSPFLWNMKDPSVEENLSPRSQICWGLVFLSLGGIMVIASEADLESHHHHHSLWWRRRWVSPVSWRWSWEFIS